MELEQMLACALDHVEDSKVKQAMLYSLTAGGKRIRPSFLLMVLKGYQGNVEWGVPFAQALEMIHTYSLIHDDLPAMDDDDLRRGRPTCHKQFDEATAILAGDGLLTEAFHTASKSSAPADRVVKCISILAEAAGPDGMVLGQVLDMQENENTSWSDVKKIHAYKTGCLLSAPLMIGAALAGYEEAIDAWKQIGTKIGLAFQIQDDILDVLCSQEDLGKSNSDTENGKVTSVTLLGIEHAEEIMNKLYEEAICQIVSMGGFESRELVELIQSIQTRRK